MHSLHSRDMMSTLSITAQIYQRVDEQNINTRSYGPVILTSDVAIYICDDHEHKSLVDVNLPGWVFIQVTRLHSRRALHNNLEFHFNILTT